MSLEEAIRLSIWNVLDGVNTAFPAKVESYDYTSQKASIKPLLKKRYIDNTVIEMPKIVGVPVHFQRSGGASFTFPIKKGDTGLAICAQRSLDKWLSEGSEAAPKNRRKFDISDAVFFPGIIPFSEKSLAENNDDVLLVYDNFKIKIDKAGKLSIGKGDVELLDLILQLIDALLGSTVATQVGPQQLSKVLDGTLINLKTKLSSIAGKL